MEFLYKSPRPFWFVGWFIMRALTTSAGVPIIAPTNLKTFLIGLVMDQVSAWATFREEKNCALKLVAQFG